MKQRLTRLLRSHTLKVMALTFTGMVAALGLDVIIAKKLGASSESDVIVAAMMLILFLDTMGREGLTHSCVQIFVEKRHHLDDAAFERYVSGFLNASLAAGLVVMAGVIVGTRPLAFMLAPGLSEELLDRVVLLIRLASPAICFTLPVTLLGALLNSLDRFGPAASRNVVIRAVVCGVALAGWSSPYFAQLCLGGFAVAFGLFLAYLFFCMGKAGIGYHPLVFASRAELREFFRLTYRPSLSVMVAQISQVAQRAAASLLPAGSMAMYYFAFRLYSAVQTLIGVSLATTALPKMARDHLGGDDRVFRNHLKKVVPRVVLLVAPVALAILLFSEDLVRLVYMRGNFGEESVRTTARVLFWFGWGIVFYCMIPVFNSVLYAKKLHNRFLFARVFACAARLGLMAVLIAPYGLNGIAMGDSIASTLVLLLLVFLTRAPKEDRAAPPLPRSTPAPPR